MLAVLSLTLPIYLLLGTGYASCRYGLFSGADIRVLGRFVLNFALPALVFSGIAQRPVREIVDVVYLAAYGGGSLLVFVGTFVLARWGRGKPMADGALIGLGSSLSNSGFVGFAIVTQWLGPPATVALALCFIVENVVVIPLTLALAEGGSGGHSWQAGLRQALARVAVSPLFLALVAGFAIALPGIPLPAPLLRAIGLLANASTAVAIFVIGGTLVGLSVHGMWLDIAQVAVGKLVAHPLAVAALFWVLPATDPTLTAAAIAYASMPMLSIYPILGQKYGREGLCAAALLATTLASLVTINVALWLLGTLAGVGGIR